MSRTRPRSRSLSLPLATVLTAALAACSDAPPADPVAAMNDRIASTTARAEHDAERLTVRHILVSFNGAPKTEATRTFVEAEKFAAELLAKLDDGADFGDLMKKHSDDPGPGEYPMCANSVMPPPGVTQRSGMVPAFGNVAWRLEVGEISVAPHHEKDSPFGWHVIQRTE